MVLADSLRFNRELVRFFSRLLGEAVHFRAGQVRLLATGGESGCAQILRNGRELKRFEIGLDWSSRLSSWLDCMCPDGDDDFAIRRKEEVLRAQLVRKNGEYLLNEITTQPLDIALHAAGFDESEVRSIEAMLRRSSGLVVLVATAEFNEGIKRKIAAIAGAGLSVELTKANVGSALQIATGEGLVFGTIKADSIKDALKRLIADGISFEKYRVCGFITFENNKLVWRSPHGDKGDTKTARAPEIRDLKIDSTKPVPYILIVEDDRDQQDILAIMLRSDGFEVGLAHNGVEALDQLRNRKPSLILADLMMPVMDGKQLLQKLKSMPEYKDIPVVILTAIDDETKELELLTQGARDYCIKATQPRILLQKIRNHVSQ